MAPKTLTVLGSQIRVNDILTSKPNAVVEEVCESIGLSRTLFFGDAQGMKIVWDERSYEVTRDVPDVTPRPVLVVGRVATRSDRTALRAFALDVATEVGVPATYALHNDYNVRDFAAVYVFGCVTELHDTVGLLLAGEALAEGVDVFDAQAPEDATECPCGMALTVRTVLDEAGWPICGSCNYDVHCAICGENEGDGPYVELFTVGTTFYPVHPACLAAQRRHHARTKLVAA